MDLVIVHNDGSKFQTTTQGITHWECPILHSPYLAILNSSSWGGQQKDDGRAGSTEGGFVKGKQAYQGFFSDSTPEDSWPNSECKGCILCILCIPAPSLGQCTGSSARSTFIGRRPFGEIEEDVWDQAIGKVSCSPWSSWTLEEGQPWTKVETSRWARSCQLG